MLFQLQRELRRKSLVLVLSAATAWPDRVYRQPVRREGEEPGEGERTLCSAQGEDG